MTVAEAPPVELDLVVDQLLFIDPNRLEPNPLNPRKDLGDLEEMAQTIRDGGVREPLLVTPAGIVVAGHRRLAAAVLADAAEVPVIARNLTEAQQLETMLVENLQRTDITPLEEAQAYQQLLDLGALEGDIVAAVGVREERIRKRTALLALPNNARELLETGAMTMGAAEQLVKLKDHPEKIADIVDAATKYSKPEHLLKYPIKDLAWQVDSVVREMKVEQRRAKAEETAKKKGLKVVKLPDPYGKGKARLLGKHYRQVDVAAKEHAALKCHAVAINDNGDLVGVCTKPENHPDATDDQPSTSSPSSSTRSNYEAQRRLEGERAAKRRAIITEALQGDPKPVHDLVSRLLLAGRGAPGNVNDSDLCEVLGIEVPDDGDPTGVFAKWLIENDMPPLRVNRALAAIILLSADTDFIENGGDAGTPPLIYAAWLQERGYELPEDTGDSSWDIDQKVIADFLEKTAADPTVPFVQSFAW